MKTDVVIIGAGVVGCAVARELTRFNVNVTVLEAGSDVAVAKRKGRDWFVAVENGAEERRITIKLDFLGEDSCELLGFADAEDRPDGYRIDRRAVGGDEKIELTLRPCGGYCARISPAKGRRICRSSRSISTRRSTTSSTWVDRYHYTAAGYELLVSQVVKRVSAARVCSASGLEG